MAKRTGGVSSSLISIIGDDDTVTGFLLTGIGERNNKGESNFLVVDDSKCELRRNNKRRDRDDFQEVPVQHEHFYSPHKPARMLDII